ncbi:hypothetical protein F2Q69_00025420 [Brassica cretica]|uniref:Uncharacterized protein n=1 Tax=Brassica cretica TaxID=69181 RepID=A0A8S9QI53_BRACR|nr:hypothetical protein F2Q69_00025420 [Brassica cretica]
MWRKKQSDVMRFCEEGEVLAEITDSNLRLSMLSGPTRPDKARGLGYKAKQVAANKWRRELVGEAVAVEEKDDSWHQCSTSMWRKKQSDVMRFCGKGKVLTESTDSNLRLSISSGPTHPDKARDEKSEDSEEKKKREAQETNKKRRRKKNQEM